MVYLMEESSIYFFIRLSKNFFVIEFYSRIHSEIEDSAQITIIQIKKTGSEMYRVAKIFLSIYLSISTKALYKISYEWNLSFWSKKGAALTITIYISFQSNQINIFPEFSSIGFSFSSSSEFLKEEARASRLLLIQIDFHIFAKADRKRKTITDNCYKSYVYVVLKQGPAETYFLLSQNSHNKEFEMR